MAKQYFALLEFEQLSTVIRVATQSGVLDEFTSETFTAEEIATKHRGSTRAYRLLLDTLAALGYLTSFDGGYGASDAFKELRSDISLNWAHLPEFLKSGAPWIEIDQSVDTLDRFYSAFFSDVDYASQMAPVADAVALRLDGKPKRILDVGTGTGLWSLAMARHLPRTHVTGVDLRGVLSTHFLRRAEALGYTDRVDVIEGDFHEVRFPEDRYDRVVLGSSFHFVREEASSELLDRLSASLKPGGQLVIIDHFANATESQRLSRILYEMRLAMRTAHAKNYSRTEIEVLCSRTGLTLSSSFEVEGPGFLAVLVFKKPVVRETAVSARVGHMDVLRSA